MKPFRIAVPKGNVSISTLFRRMGYRLPDDFDESRKYIIPVDGTKLEFVLAKEIDIPTYVEYGVADVGIVGKDVLLEEKRDIYELLDLGISLGSISVMGMSKKVVSNPRVATNYPKITSKHFKEKGIQAEIVKLNGGLELALLSGLVDYIVEAAYEGTFSKFNFIEIEKVCNISCRLIANIVSFHVNNNLVEKIYEDIYRYSLR
ncbi:ATP phosphoribosyltransferase [Paenibacillus periandrae]|uniref:ATP phosphoribosyltransferase n=1 Tax=Paenibacillus periandrae TaxID=1761741 RepID=UPI001F08E8E9|nr:ATP phosphoribosyltransferase [Paenibacillus periandrae]